MSYQYRNISKTSFCSKEDNNKRDEIINILKLYKEKFFGKNDKKSYKVEFPKLTQSKSFKSRRILKNVIESKKRNESKISFPKEIKDTIKYIISPYKDKRFYNNELNKILREKKIQRKNKSQKCIFFDSEKQYWNKENNFLSNYKIIKINDNNNNFKNLSRNYSIINRNNYFNNSNSNTYSFWNKKLLFRNKNKNGDIYDLINISNKYLSTLNKINNNNLK